MPFWGALFFMSSSLISAQLKVNSSGNVGIGTTNPQSKLDVAGDIYIGSASNIFGTTNNVPITFMVNGSLAGSTGSSGNPNVSFGYGALLNYNGSGGANTSVGYYALSLSTGSGNTAIGSSALSSNTTGSGNTAVGVGTNVSAGNLENVTVIGNGVIATGSNQVRIGNSNVGSIGGHASWSNISDGRIKKNIRTNVPGLIFINSLQPVTYNLDLDALDELLGIENNNNTYLLPELIELNRKAREVKQKQVQTGFLAQDVEKTAKSIGYDFSGVDVDESGIYSLRYAEFVVPLVKSVQELSEQNDRLQEQVNDLTYIVNKLMGKDNDPSMFKSGNVDTSISGITNPLVSQCKLYQNAPNPFKDKTEILYYLSPGVQSAEIYIFNLQGSLLKKIPAHHSCVVEIKGSNLQAGMYLYTLVADGQAVDTKRMILTK